MASISDIASNLEDAVSRWEDAVQEVQDAISELDNLDEDQLPAEILSLLQEIRGEEPDLGAPQTMLYQAQELVKKAEELEEDEDEDEDE